MSKVELDSLKVKLQNFVDGGKDKPTAQELDRFQKLVIQLSKQAVAGGLPAILVDEKDDIDKAVKKKLEEMGGKPRVVVMQKTKDLQQLLANAIGKLSA